jgi:hypothetical protein
MKTKTRITLLLFAEAAITLSPARSFLYPTNPLSVPVVADQSPITHVGIGFLNGYVMAGDPKTSYSGPARLPVQSVRANASFGFAIHESDRDRYRIFDGFAYARSINPRATLQMVISDGYFMGTPKPWPYTSPETAREWEYLVDQSLRECIARFGTSNVQVDLFNEPDSKVPNGSTQSDVDRFLSVSDVAATDFYDTWKKAVRHIRKNPEWAGVKIIGPSISGYNAFVLRFLEAANADGVLPDVVSWHELDDGSKLDLDGNVSEVRAYMHARGIPDRQISINEYLDNAERTSPGISIAFFERLEKAGVSTAIKSCWTPEDCGTYYFQGGNYNGLYGRSDSTFHPRSIWWAYRWYADMSGTLLQTPALGKSEVFLGVLDSSARKLQLVFANATQSKVVDSRTVRIERIPADFLGACRIKVELLKNEGETIHVKPKVLVDRTLELSSSTLHFEVPRLNAGDALRYILIRQ